MYIDASRGSNGVLVGNTVLFMIEGKKVKDTKAWLKRAASSVGLSSGDYKIVGNVTEDVEKHHLCHAHAAYFQSGFSDASILIIDGMNRIGGTSIGIYKAEGNKIEEVRTYPMDYSLGSFYSSGTVMCGFGWDKAGKLMGLSAYSNRTRECPPFFLVDPKTGDITESNARFEPKEDRVEFVGKEFLKAIWGSDNLSPRENFDFRCAVAAATYQKLFEQSVFSLLKYIHSNLPSRNLVMGGGCALNCVCNGKIIRSGLWDNLYIPNMCEDSGNLVGRMTLDFNQEVTSTFMYNKVTYPVPPEFSKVISEKNLAKRIREGQIIAWFEGGSEYGPRALCHRSILANPELAHTAYRVNEIKNREYWRPLAPVVLDTHFKKIFNVPGRVWEPHKTMLATEYLREKWKTRVPAVCAPDGSSRPQVLVKGNKDNEVLYSLMSNHHLPILVNTSMNGADEPICETPEDAIEFASRNNDVLLVFVKDGKIFMKG